MPRSARRRTSTAARSSMRGPACGFEELLQFSVRYRGRPESPRRPAIGEHRVHGCIRLTCANSFLAHESSPYSCAKNHQERIPSPSRTRGAARTPLGPGEDGVSARPPVQTKGAVVLYLGDGPRAASTAWIIFGLSGLTREPKRATTRPSRPTRNLLKFHVMRPENSGFVSLPVRNA